MDRRNRKRYFQSKSGDGGGGSGAKKSKGKRNRLEPGMSGFIVTCSTKDESRCVREIYNLLNDYMDRQREQKIGDDGIKKEDGEELLESQPPPEKSPSSEHLDQPIKQESQSDDDEGDDEEDLEKALKKECDALTGRVQQEDGQEGNSGRKFPPKRFLSMDTGVSNNIFITTSTTTTDTGDLDPSTVVKSILMEIKASGKCQSRFIQRILPVDMTCKAYLDDIERALIANKDLLSRHFSSKDDPPTYAIFFKPRNNDHLKRDDIIRVVGDLIVSTNPMVKVDLEKPKKAVLIEVLKTVACISIVDEYIELCKYNLHMVAKGEEGK